MVSEDEEETGELKAECSFGADDFTLRSATKDCLTPCYSASGLVESAKRMVPIVDWLPKYRWKEDFMSDAIAGLTVGVMHVPQGIAYALLSGVEPVSGLYISLLAPTLYMLFGTSRHTALGSFAVVALMTGVTNERIFAKYHPNTHADANLLGTDDHADVTPASIVATLTFTIGLIQLATALLKLDFIATYFSDPLVAGFSTGAAVHVLFSQLDDIMGIALPRLSGAGYLFEVAYRLVTSLPQANIVTLCASAVAIAFLVIGKDYISPFINRRFPFHLVIPYDLLVLIISTGVSYAYDWNTVYEVPIVGAIPTGGALAIAVVIIAVHLSMAKLLAKRYGYKIDPSQELYALGISSTVSGFFPVYPASTALGRTMVNVESGARTQLSVIFGSTFLLTVIFFLGPLLWNLPLCMLSCVIVVSLRPMFKKFGELSHLWQISKYDFIIWLISFAATVAIDVIGGLIVSIVLALFTVVVRTQRAEWKARIWEETQHEAECCIFFFDSSLLFTNDQHFSEGIRETVKKWKTRSSDKSWEADGKRRIFIMDMSAMPTIDYMGICTLKSTLDELKSEEIQVLLVSAREHIKKVLISELESPADGNSLLFFPTMDEALASIRLREVAKEVAISMTTL